MSAELAFCLTGFVLLACARHPSWRRAGGVTIALAAIAMTLKSCGALGP